MAEAYLERPTGRVERTSRGAQRSRPRGASVAGAKPRGKMRAMFGIGPLEVILVLAVGLVVLGPRRLPELARQIGKIMGEVRRTTHELRSTLDAELHEEERDQRRRDAEERRRKFRESRDQARASGEWPPGGVKESPQPSVAADSLVRPAEGAVEAGRPGVVLPTNQETPYADLVDSSAPPAAEPASAPEPGAKPAVEPPAGDPA